VTVYPDGDPSPTYYKFGKTPDNLSDHWYEFLYDGSAGAEILSDRIVVHFVDGQRGDHDIKENGRITDPGGPAGVLPHPVLYLPYIATGDGEETQIGIINTEPYVVDARISYYRENGDLILEKEFALSSMERIVISSAGIPPDTAGAVVEADGDLAGYERYVSADGKRCSWPGATRLCRCPTIPAIIPSADWRSGLGIFNPGDGAVDVIVSLCSGGSEVFTLEAKGNKVLWIEPPDAAARITTSGNVAAVEILDHVGAGFDMCAVLLQNRYLSSFYVPAISLETGTSTGIAMADASMPEGPVFYFQCNEPGGAVEVVTVCSAAAMECLTTSISGVYESEENNTVWAEFFGEKQTAFGPSPILYQGLAAYAGRSGEYGAVKLNALRFRKGFLAVTDAELSPTFAFVNPGAEDASVTVTAHQSDGTILSTSAFQIGAGQNMTGMVADLTGGASSSEVSHIRLESDTDIYGFETIYAGDCMEMLPVLATE